MKKNLKWIVISIVIILLAVFGYIKYVQDFKLSLVTSSINNDYETKLYMVGKPVMPYGPTKCRAKIYHEGNEIQSYDFTLYNDGANVFADDFEFEWHEKFVRIIASASEMDTNDGTFDFYFIVE